MLVPLTSPIAWSHGTQNMVVTSGQFGGDVVFSGHGAGGEPTAVAVVSDLLAVAQRSVAVQLPVRRRQVTGEFLAPHYLRFVVDDKPGIVAGIAGALAKVGANIDSLLQQPRASEASAAVCGDDGALPDLDHREGRGRDREDGLHAGAAAVPADPTVDDKDESAWRKPSLKQQRISTGSHRSGRLACGPRQLGPVESAPV